jgi:hypothetical protein
LALRHLLSGMCTAVNGQTLSTTTTLEARIC